MAPPIVEVQDEEAPSGADLASEALYRAEAERELDEEEELFNLEENIAHPTSYNWEDKYRPRKPRYFNRVHTGYEWNKYNQTHYEYVLFSFFTPVVLYFFSTDNPPPKVVQGYKVCIAYLFYIHVMCLPCYSSTSSIPISSTRRKLQRTKLSRSQGTTRLYYYISRLAHHTKTSHSGLSTENGNSRTNGTTPPWLEDSFVNPNYL